MEKTSLVVLLCFIVVMAQGVECSRKIGHNIVSGKNPTAVQIAQSLVGKE